jgi:hypothetical protein
MMNEVMEKQIGLPVTPMEEIGAFRVQRPGDPADGYYLDILIMLYNVRLVETPVIMPLVYDRYWCYEGRSLTTFLRVVGEAMVWNRDPEIPEPHGWVKAWDGRRRPR